LAIPGNQNSEVAKVWDDVAQKQLPGSFQKILVSLRHKSKFSNFALLTQE